MYSTSQGANYYAIHSLLYLRTIQEKNIKMDERFVNQLKEYLQAIRILSKGLFTYIAFATFKISKTITGSKTSVNKN